MSEEKSKERRVKDCVNRFITKRRHRLRKAVDKERGEAESGWRPRKWSEREQRYGEWETAEKGQRKHPLRRSIKEKKRQQGY